VVLIADHLNAPRSLIIHVPITRQPAFLTTRTYRGQGGGAKATAAT